MSDYFITYPDIDDPDFYSIIFNKNEFNKTAYDTGFRYKQTGDLCRKGEFRMQNHQEFIRNFMSPETPYNGLLMFHGTGVGKTCGAIGATEGLRNYVKGHGKIYIIAPEQIEPNFRKELYDPIRAAVEKEYHSMPGSYQCAGDTYYAESETATKRLINTYYEIMGAVKFCNFVDIGLGAALPPELKKPRILDSEGNKIDIGDYFTNSVIVIDEAHGIAGFKKGGKKDADYDDTDDNDDNAEAEADAEVEVDAEVEENDIDLASQSGEVRKIAGKRAKTYISKRSILKVLLDTIIPACHAKGRKLKIILLTATPMKDNIRELADLLELLNANDGRMTKEERQQIYNMLPTKKDSTDDIRESMEQLRDRNSPLVRGLKQLSRGYISYVKGNNPITFPQALLPDPQYLYEPGQYPNGQPKPIFAYRDQDHTNIRDIRYNIRLDNGDQFRFNLVKCPMSIYQLKYYNTEIRGDESLDTGKKGKSGKSSKTSKSGKTSETGGHGDMYTRMLSNIALPLAGGNTANDQGVIEFIEGTYEGKIPVGDKMFDDIFNPRYTNKSEGKRSGKHVSYEYKAHIFEKYGNFLQQDNPNYPLSMFSRKLDMFMDFIKQSGIAYVYSDLVKLGAVITAMVLEANGFLRYEETLKNHLNDGLPPADIYEKCPGSHLFNNPGAIKPKEFYLCARCGKTYNKCRAEDSLVTIKELKHSFSVSTYIIVAGDHGTVSDITEATTNNVYGDKIKVVIGTRKTGQGVDLKWVRHIHIVDPWHNNTRIYQAIGRGIRHCSHADLPPHMRNVVVYKYCSVADDSTINITADDLKSPTFDFNNPVTFRLEQDDGSVINLDIGMSYYDFFTETVDERMYQRAVSKDLQIKAIERICKEAAVDCELNRMRNHFPEYDKDYTRECDFTLCKYTCDGFVEPIKYIRRIRRTRTDPPQWFIIDDEGDIKPIADLRTIPHLENRAKSRLKSLYKGTAEIRDSQHLWDLLKPSKMIIKEGTKEGLGNNPHEADAPYTYEDMLVDIPLITIDNSTYDVYFSLPQIDRAIKIITRIFQRYQALSLEKIIHLVSSKDSGLENEYIYLAMDRLVGSPPKVQPLSIIDKYGRRGHLIYHNGFYIYQPREIKDIHIPLAYRSKPLSIKVPQFSMSILESKKPTAVIEKVSEEDQKMVTVDLNAIRSLSLGSSKSQPDESILSIASSINFIVSLYTMLNSYTPAEHRFIIETIVTGIFNSDVSAISLTDAYILEYYLRSGLVIFGNWKPKDNVSSPSISPNDFNDNNIVTLLEDMKSNAKNTNSEIRTIVHYLATSKIRKYYFIGGRWIWNEEAYDMAALMDIQDPQNRMYPSAPAMNGNKRGALQLQLPLNTSSETGGFYSMMSISSDQRASELIKDDRQYVARLQNAVEKLHKTYPDRVSMGKIKFKMIDQSTKKAGATTAKCDIRGRACTSFSVSEANSAYTRLMDILYENFGSDIGPYETLDAESYLALLSIKTAEPRISVICKALQELCIILDYYYVNGVRWYLNPLETEIYRPKKN
jgi:hypothetical protein